MCARITCRSCGKPTWTGCGNHIEIVLRGVAPEDRCRCRVTRSDGTGASEDPPKLWYQK